MRACPPSDEVQVGFTESGNDRKQAEHGQIDQRVSYVETIPLESIDQRLGHEGQRGYKSGLYERKEE